MNKTLIGCVAVVLVVTLCVCEGAPQWEESRTLRKQQREKGHSNLEEDSPIWARSHHHQLNAHQVRSDESHSEESSSSSDEFVQKRQQISKLYHETDPGIARNGHQKMNVITSRADHHRSDMYNLPVDVDDAANKISKID